MSGERILLVEDEPSLVLSLVDRLRSEGYEVDSATDGDDGFALASEGAYDLILLDVQLPGRSGFDVCRDLRRESVETPVLMLTARGQVVDKVLGLKLGADDYLVKPFDMLELSARIEALLRRRPRRESGPEVHAFGDVRVDLRRAEVTRDGKPVALSALEFRLLQFFLEHRGEMLSRDVLLDQVWGYDESVYSRTVDVHVAALRQKLERQPARPRYIETLRGLGYRFVG